MYPYQELNATGESLYFNACTRKIIYKFKRRKGLVICDLHCNSNPLVSASIKTPVVADISFSSFYSISAGKNTLIYNISQETIYYKKSNCIYFFQLSYFRVFLLKRHRQMLTGFL